MLKDGLWDVYNDVGMGACAQICAENHTGSRKEQDDYASQSSERVFPAFAWEIVPVEVSGERGKPPTIVDKDDGLGKFDVGKLPKLSPTFKENGGTVNARNSSSGKVRRRLLRVFPMVYNNSLCKTKLFVLQQPVTGPHTVLW